jgi:hypothetical protein
MPLRKRKVDDHLDTTQERWQEASSVLMKKEGVPILHCGITDKFLSE